uniref:PHD finger protein 7 n=1 Tax=Coturnix japonica TaxID=93934 RepID=A0A8C2YA60_COTJA
MWAPQTQPSGPPVPSHPHPREGEHRAFPQQMNLCHVLVSPRCGLCHRTDDDPEIYGEMCRQDRICVHENCLVTLHCCPQICCICRKKGASVRCHNRRCSRTFHFPCGTERRCVSQFFGEYRSFCWQHRPTQQVQPLRQQHPQCVICMEEVYTRPSYNTLVCPSCRSAMFHRHCIQVGALSAALHHFRCPLCQETQTFKDEMLRLGIKIPDRDAAWELAEAFQELYERHSTCDTSVCLLYLGLLSLFRPWRMLLCSSCGSCGTHQQCSAIAEDAESWECSGCSGVSTGKKRSTGMCPCCAAPFIPQPLGGRKGFKE